MGNWTIDPKIEIKRSTASDSLKAENLPKGVFALYMKQDEGGYVRYGKIAIQSDHQHEKRIWNPSNSHYEGPMNADYAVFGFNHEDDHKHKQIKSKDFPIRVYTFSINLCLFVFFFCFCFFVKIKLFKLKDQFVSITRLNKKKNTNKHKLIKNVK